MKLNISLMQQDNVPKHIIKSTTEWLQNKKKHLLEWPIPLSETVSVQQYFGVSGVNSLLRSCHSISIGLRSGLPQPIEMLWNDLKRAVK
jgi:hypothetical protein